MANKTLSRRFDWCLAVTAAVALVASSPSKVIGIGPVYAASHDATVTTQPIFNMSGIAIAMDTAPSFQQDPGAVALSDRRAVVQTFAAYRLSGVEAVKAAMAQSAAAPTPAAPDADIASLQQLVAAAKLKGIKHGARGMGRFG